MYTFGEEQEIIIDTQETNISNIDTNKINTSKNAIAPLTMMFHNIGWNMLHSFAHNYGLSFIGAGLGTWAIIETGFDWKWRNIAYKHKGLYKLGIPTMYFGTIVPVIAPVAAYITGRVIKDQRLQITGLALVQSLALTLGVQTTFKMITGRPPPDLVTELDETRVYRPDDFSREFNWFSFEFIDGWPSGHVAHAFAAAATASEIYHNNIYLKIGLYTYAAFVGFSTMTTFHWASEVFAGALIGYAIGKTVGKSYRKYLENETDKNNITFYATTNSLGVLIRL